MTKVKENIELKPHPGVRGMPKSNRFWKSTKNERSTSNIKSKRKEGVKKLQNLRDEKTRVKAMSQMIKDTRKTELDDKRRREYENKQRKEENARKSEVVQVIKNSAKLKRMKKKQLRKVEKRDTTVVEKDKPKTAAAATPKAKKPEKMETA